MRTVSISTYIYRYIDVYDGVIRWLSKHMGCRDEYLLGLLPFIDVRDKQL
jgi:hypothetical protein